MSDTAYRKKIIAGTASILFSMLSLISGCAGASEISAIPPNALIVDVRTPSEYASWHYPDAINIPVQVLRQNMDKLGNRDRTIVVYCRSGNRSTAAKKILMENGFSNVKNGGGLSDMKRL